MSIKPHSKILLFCVMLLCITSSPGWSRAWKPNPDAKARDYTTITDNRGNGEIVVLMWFAPPMVAPSLSGAQILAALLEKYTVIVVVHGHVNPTTGAMTFDDFDTLEARDQREIPLTLVPRDSLPPTTAGVLTTLETLFRQSFGAMGKGMKTFVFEAGAVHSCEKGGLSALHAGETYTWETPIPGCP
jgi:hypothetical protein